ncbi:MAG: hypothetical protein ABI999_03625 [Acidobacteriota bacterium]
MKFAKSFLPVLTVSLSLFTTVACAQDETIEASKMDPGKKVSSTIAGIRYSVPKGFEIEKSPYPRTVFLRSKESTAIFITITDSRPDNKTLNDIASNVVTEFAPAEQAFKWKPTGVDEEAASTFEVKGGSAKGQSKAKKVVQLYYKVLKNKNKFLTIGYVMDFGDETAAQSDFAYSSEGIVGGSMPAWYALTHVIVSITGEKYDDILDKLPTSLTAPIN